MADPTKSGPRKIKIVNADPCNTQAEATIDGKDSKYLNSIA